jgi:hypothetical protein
LAFIYTTKWVSASEERHLTFRVAAIGTTRVRLDELADREAIGGFTRDMVTYSLMKLVSMSEPDRAALMRERHICPAVFASIRHFGFPHRTCPMRMRHALPLLTFAERAVSVCC